MTNKKLKTDYAPAERASSDQINQEADLLIALPLLSQLLDSIPDIVLILNAQRQIVFANQALADAFGILDRREIYGTRPGEALQCIHADETIGGCGTTSFCKTCGAVNAILSGLRGKKKTEECRISQKNTGNAFDLRVAATPFKSGDCSFVIFVATDISSEKRRNVLERTFFHDISNTLTGVVGYADLLHISSSSDRKDLLEELAINVHRLQEEINSQKGLISAESGDLSVCPESIRSREFLHEMVTFYKKGNFSSASMQTDIDDTSIDIMFVSDRTLLSRVFGNMLKNAIEASQPTDKVLAGCRLDNNNSICFWVQNPQFIPPDIQLQIFNRSFSTKGAGRGIGTYSMKLLGEKYLKGKVAFSTAHDQGTIFSVTLPLILE
jgi:nitrogen fixation/metabolism regulation signal transduction histidine kinase